VSASKLVVVSNRGPMQEGEGGWVRSAGGLVTALDPVLRARGGVWVSSSPSPPPEERPDLGYELAHAVFPGKEAGFYEGVSNGILWPLMHSFPATLRVGEAPWDDYCEANHAFARVCIDACARGDQVWIHDYHLMLVPRLLRKALGEARIGWFCHIPWPSSELFGILPWRRELLDGLLGADVLGFHTTDYVTNFLSCAERLAGARVDYTRGTVESGGRVTTVVTAPVGVPVADLEELARADATLLRANEIKESLLGRRILLGVDRLDYTKGIPERILAYRRLLEQRPSAAAETVFVQVMVPSRTDVEAYALLKEEIDRLVGEVNGRFGQTGRVPIHYLYRNMEWPALVAHYRAADVALVTPLRDGMNLVAQEYAAARVDGDGVLVLSEFAGAARYLTDAVLVNPYDVGGMAAALELALTMPEDERRRRMASVMAATRKLDVHNWSEQFLARLEQPAAEANGRALDVERMALSLAGINRSA
jgi:trehalose 6-phosphate synthase/phosphatase